MDRTIVGFHRDPNDNWVAELDCGHDQHVYHRPPFQVRPWVLSPDGRGDRIGTPLDCPLCDRAELPEHLRSTGLSPEWDAHSLPPSLRRAHRLAAGTWGLLVLREGSLTFRARTTPPIDCMIQAGATQPIPPGIEHEVEPGDEARLFIQFFQVVPYGSRQAVDRAEAGRSEIEPDLGGESACWAHLLCPECGRLGSEGHLKGCSLA